MWKNCVSVLGLAFMIGACGTLPPHPLEGQAKQFRPASDKAVIYVFRDAPDFGNAPTTISFDGLMIGTTYPGTFYRWEAAPGERTVAGIGHDTGEIKLKVEAGRVYYVQQAVWVSKSSYVSFFNTVNEMQGKASVQSAMLLDAF